MKILGSFSYDRQNTEGEVTHGPNPNPVFSLSGAVDIERFDLITTPLIEGYHSNMPLTADEITKKPLYGTDVVCWWYTETDFTIT